MRHTLPSLIRHSYPEANLGNLSWGRMAELAASESWSKEPGTPKRSQRDIRTRRSKLPGDFGVNLAFNASAPLQRSQSCTHKAVGVSETSLAAPPLAVGSMTLPRPTAGESSTQAAEVSTPPRRIARCDSMPPTGTSKADSDAAAQAKARAVAALQRLFFEEMAKGGQDPSGAAAKALLRLSQAPQEEPSSTPPPPRVEAVPAKARLQPPAEVEIPVEAPEPEPEAEAVDRSSAILTQQVAALAARPVMPRRPTHDDGIGMSSGRRRPRPTSRVAIRS
jgi:hypothetical protein